MASIDDLRTGDNRTGMGTASGTDDGVLVIDNPNVKNQNKPSQSKPKPVKQLIPETEEVEEREVIKPKRVAADLSSLPKDEVEGVENIHESIEDDILKAGGPFDQYIARKQQEMEEVNRLIDEHNEAVALERGEDVPTDDQLEEMAKTGESTNNLTGVLIGTKYYDQADEYGRGLGEVNGSPLEEKMEKDSELKKEILGEKQEENPSNKKASAKDLMADEEEYVDPMEAEIEAEFDSQPNSTPKIQTRPTPQPVEPTAQTSVVKEAKNINKTKPANVEDEDEFDIDPDEDDTTQADSIVEIQEVDETENMKQFQASISEKIRPVRQKLNLSSFRVIKNPVNISTATLQPDNDVAMDWGLFNSKQHISMKKFTGQELERLSERINASNFQDQKNRFRMLYEHVVSPKPNTLEQWLKTISFNDIDHLYFAAYGAGFANSHYVPYDCSKCKNTFLSENFPLEALYKYKDDDAKQCCEKLINSQDGVTPGLYTTEFIQISDDFAVTFRDPSVWNAVFENAILDEKFATKYRTVLALCMYIDEFWKIGDGSIAPIGYKIDVNNLAKTVKARTITYGKIVASLTTDQYNLILACINAINGRTDDVSYIRPEVVCPNCGTVIPEATTTGEELLFTRGQLAALSLTSIS